MLVCGQSGCGKTNTIMHMLRNPLVYFDKIYLYTPNEKGASKKVMDRVSADKVGYDVMEINEYPERNRKIVVFDDHVNAPDKIQPETADYFTD